MSWPDRKAPRFPLRRLLSLMRWTRRLVLGLAVRVQAFLRSRVALDVGLAVQHLVDPEQVPLVFSFFEQRIFGPLRIERLEKQLRANSREQRKGIEPELVSELRGEGGS